ncbi:ATP-binding protein [Paenibacillus cremeus]|uniref:DNA topoisomerase (ATP-hydrolyzing) n=1 Tax=Paenibacillus cremeus TaxID=2163881 RepID=A0A559KEJ5_9BACL|nr:ATP-binding protein [Paenibacillus cremeus]TVY10533.1 helix-turn-helix domain-containing protein [Paenibacillus cremeus]
MSRDYGAEIDRINLQMQELLKALEISAVERGRTDLPKVKPLETRTPIAGKQGAVYYSGQIDSGEQMFRWAPQERELAALIAQNHEKAAKVLSALGHKQRLEIMTAVLHEPLTGTELVERLQMGTTGQLYHHMKALLGADLLQQEDRGGRYSLPKDRILPIMLLLAAVSDLQDTCDYMDMTEVRAQAGRYLGTDTGEGYDTYQLLWAVVENSILEHKAGFCSEIWIYLHDDGSMTVADNGRGIPVQTIPQTEKSMVQAVLTDLNRTIAPFTAPGAEKGINIAVINALSRKLSVEIRRDGAIYRQEYKNGVPQTGLNKVGATSETGTSVTLLPDPELFGTRMNREVLEAKVAEFMSHYEGLRVTLS